MHSTCHRRTHPHTPAHTHSRFSDVYETHMAMPRVQSTQWQLVCCSVAGYATTAQRTHASSTVGWGGRYLGQPCVSPWPHAASTEAMHAAAVRSCQRKRVPLPPPPPCASARAWCPDNHTSTLRPPSPKKALTLRPVGSASGARGLHLCGRWPGLRCNGLQSARAILGEAKGLHARGHQLRRLRLCVCVRGTAHRRQPSCVCAVFGYVMYTLS
jgi:hypothetical protein